MTRWPVRPSLRRHCQGCNMLLGVAISTLEPLCQLEYCSAGHEGLHNELTAPGKPQQSAIILLRWVARLGMGLS
eukprot:6468983-Amphidinium_carterae.1